MITIKNIEHYNTIDCKYDLVNFYADTIKGKVLLSEYVTTDENGYIVDKEDSNIINNQYQLFYSVFDKNISVTEVLNEVEKQLNKSLLHIKVYNDDTFILENDISITLNNDVYKDSNNNTYQEVLYEVEEDLYEITGYKQI